MQEITQQDLPAISPVLDAGETAIIENEQSFDVRFGYRIGVHRFVLERTLLTEIVVRPKIYPIPRSPAWLCGVINLRGTIVPVIDLSESLSTVSNSTPGDYVLVIDKGSDAVALIVDGPPMSLINPQPAQQDAATLQSKFIQPGVTAQNHAWMLLDAKGLARHLGADTVQSV
ncbi:MAG: hypothetical protein GC149_10445 [Gammaproteobacteria bacterium]|nr:hypothetical protein [Gammaproteobacteria bacterium]